MDISKKIERLRERVNCLDLSAAEFIFKKGILDILSELNKHIDNIEHNGSRKQQKGG